MHPAAGRAGRQELPQPQADRRSGGGAGGRAWPARRHGGTPPPSPMSTLNIGGSQLDASWFLLLSAILFVLGAVGVLVRRNPLVILISIELMLNAANLVLVAFSRQLVNIEGQLFALMSMTVAAAEAVVGLAILVDIFRTRDAEDIDDLSEMHG